MALKRLGLSFSQIGPNVDEDSLKESGLPPVEVARSLANSKAKVVAADKPDSLVIGSDQLVSLDGQILGKPGSMEAAVDQLLSMSGKTHELITAVAIHSPAGVDTFENIAAMTMHQLDRAAISRYVERDQPVDCAGSYKIEDAGISLCFKYQNQRPQCDRWTPSHRTCHHFKEAWAPYSLIHHKGSQN